MENTINCYPGIAASANIIQHTELLLSSLYFEHTHLYLIQQGQTHVIWEQQRIIAQTGDLLVISSGLTADIINIPPEKGVFCSQLLICDPSLHDHLCCEPQPPALSSVNRVLTIQELSCTFLHSFNTTLLAMASNEFLPPQFVRHKICEILIWLAHLSIRFSHNVPPNLTQQVRHCLASEPQRVWTAAKVAEALSMNEVMLRRKLSAEKSVLRDLMIDVRMSHALLLLQATEWSISAIAEYMGYESASRFAERFRKRFGFAPTAIRGHQRTTSSTHEIPSRDAPE